MHDAAQAVVSGAHVERFFAEHVRHGAAEGRKGRKLKHLQLEFAVTIDKVGVGEEVHPVIDIDIECAQQALVFESATLQHFLGFDFAGVAEVIDEQGAHLPSVTHFFDHDASDSAAVPVSGRGFEQVPLLFDAGKFRVALVDNHVHQGVTHLLGGNLAEVLPLAAAFVVTKLDFFGFDSTEESVKFKAGNLVAIDANFFAPFVEQTHPVTEGSDFCYFAWHNVKTSNHRGHRVSQSKHRGFRN